MSILALLAAAAVSPAAEAFEAFQTICVRTEGEPAAAAAAADRAGWKKAAESQRRQLADNAYDQNLQARLKPAAGGGMLGMIVNRSTIGLSPPVTVNMCQVTGNQANYEAMVRLAKTWAGAAPLPGFDPAKGMGFAFGTLGGRHQPLSTAELEAADSRAFRSRRIAQFSVLRANTGAALRIILPAR